MRPPIFSNTITQPSLYMHAFASPTLSLTVVPASLSRSAPHAICPESRGWASPRANRAFVAEGFAKTHLGYLGARSPPMLAHWSFERLRVDLRTPSLGTSSHCRGARCEKLRPVPYTPIRGRQRSALGPLQSLPESGLSGLTPALGCCMSGGCQRSPARKLRRAERLPTTTALAFFRRRGLLRCRHSFRCLDSQIAVATLARCATVLHRPREVRSCGTSCPTTMARRPPSCWLAGAGSPRGSPKERPIAYRTPFGLTSRERIAYKVFVVSGKRPNVLNKYSTTTQKVLKKVSRSAYIFLASGHRHTVCSSLAALLAHRHTRRTSRVAHRPQDDLCA